MKLLNSIATLIVVFNYCLTVLAENQFYIASIRRDKNDKNFDDESQKVQQDIEELANDRMNDIYNMIIENKETYVNEDGKLDENLNELKDTLTKRKEKKKLRFVNKNRPRSYINKRNLDVNEEIIDSNIVKFLCPIANFYTIVVYLSDSIVEKVKKLPNVIFLEKDVEVERNFEAYYDVNQIGRETNWSSIWIQPNTTDCLSLLSQSKYEENLTGKYDDNYYYPKKSGHGVDIYLIDDGLWADHKDFATKEGTEFERTVTCDAVFKNETYTKPSSSKKCSGNSEYPEHGTAMASIASGEIMGVSKYANIHMLAVDIKIGSIFAALDYILQNANPSKSIISISLGSWKEYSYNAENLINSLVNKGFIIFTSVGNGGMNSCKPNSNGEYHLFSGYNGVIRTGFTNRYEYSQGSNYGSCIDFFAHGTSKYAYTGLGKNDFKENDGASIANAAAAGLAATIMAEYPNYAFNYQTMRQALINLSLKGIISKIPSDTPNRFLNNGKKTVFSPINVYKGCGYSSGAVVCPSGGCCSKYGFCGVTSAHCAAGCQSEFGVCNGTTTTTTKKSTTTTTTTTKKSTTTTTTTKKPTTTTTTTKKPTTTTKKVIVIKKTVTIKKTVKKTTTKKATTTTKKTTTTTKNIPISTVKDRCGPDYGKCTGNNCCSKYGYCDTSNEHCGTGCQPLYGICK